MCQEELFTEIQVAAYALYLRVRDLTSHPSFVHTFVDGTTPLPETYHV